MDSKIHQVAQTASPTSYGASAVAVVGSLTANDIAMITGAIVAVATFIINWIYKEKMYQLAKRQENADKSI